MTLTCLALLTAGAWAFSYMHESVHRVQLSGDRELTLASASGRIVLWVDEASPFDPAFLSARFTFPRPVYVLQPERDGVQVVQEARDRTRVIGPQLLSGAISRGGGLQRAPSGLGTYFRLHYFSVPNISDRTITWTAFELTLPHALFVAIFAAWPTLALVQRVRRRPRPGHCPACHYDLRGSAGRDACPECGQPIITRPITKEPAAA